MRMSTLFETFMEQYSKGELKLKSTNNLRTLELDEWEKQKRYDQNNISHIIMQLFLLYYYKLMAQPNSGFSSINDAL